MTDIEITKSIQMLNIKDVAKKISIAENDLEYYGKHKAKLPLHLIEDEKIKTSKLILVTALTPTPAGEGKTTVSIGLNEGLNK
ncbi:MAG: formate--tetrahydrofolate ligase, partial [Bacteroidota bacterium]